MKGTQHFTETIKAYLDERATSDSLFARMYAKPDKTIENCITYILNSVQKSGCNGFTDEEIFSMAVHYYDEDNINIGNPINCNVVVNHTVELTEEEKEQAKKDAIKKLQDDAIAKLKKPTKKNRIEEPTVQTSLF